MPTIRNKLNQRLIIYLNSGKNIELLAKGMAEVKAEDIESEHLQSLLTKGDILVQTEEISESIEPKKTSYMKKGKTN